MYLSNKTSVPVSVYFNASNCTWVPDTDREARVKEVDNWCRNWLDETVWLGVVLQTSTSLNVLPYSPTLT